MFPILFLFLQLDTSAMVIQESIFKVSGTLFNNIIPDPTMISDNSVYGMHMTTVMDGLFWEVSSNMREKT